MIKFNMLGRILCAAVVGTLLTIRLAAAAEPVRMASLEWPPFVGEKLEFQGLATAVVHSTFAAMGHGYAVDFMDWTEAQSKATSAPYSGYYPAYLEEVRSGFIASSPVFRSPLVLVERKAAPVTFSTVGDLAGKTIGVVAGYVNTVEFDAMVASGAIPTVAAKDDAANVRNVLEGKVVAAMCDLYVMKHLLRTEPDLKDGAIALQVNPQLVEQKELFVAFRDSPETNQLREQFNETLAKVNVQGIVEGFLAKSGLK